MKPSRLHTMQFAVSAFHWMSLPMMSMCGIHHHLLFVLQKFNRSSRYLNY